MYNVVLYPLLKQYEPLIDAKALEAHHAVDECIQDFQQNGTQALTKRIKAVQKSKVVTKISQVIVSPLNSPRLKKQIRSIRSSIDRHLHRHEQVSPLKLSHQQQFKSNSVSLSPSLPEASPALDEKEAA